VDFNKCNFVFNIKIYLKTQKEVKKMKKLGILLMTLVFLIAMGGTAYGVATISEPQSGDIISGNALLEINTTLYNTSWCNVSVSSIVQNFSRYMFANTSNFTIAGASGNTTNGSINTFFLPDAIDWRLSGTCGNISAGIINTEETITAITVTLNNQVPTCTFTGFASDGSYSYKSNWTVTGKNATTGQIKFGSNNYLTMIEGNPAGSEIWNYDTTSIPWDVGSYTITASMGDGTDTTTCSLANVRITHETNTKYYKLALEEEQQIQEQIAQQQNNNNSNNKLMVVLIGGAVILFLFKKQIFGK